MLLSYTFTMIADDSGVFTLPTLPTINNAGTVAFQTSLIWGRDAIFTGNGGAHNLIAITSHPADTFPGNPTINSAGTAAFRATFGSGGQAIFTGSGGDLTTIADTRDGTFSQFLGAAQINDAGTVGFLGQLAAGGRSVSAGNGGPATALYNTVTHFHDIVSLSRFNNQGTAAMIAQLEAGVDGIYTGNGGPLTTITDTSDAFSDIRPASLNDAGMVAFRATLRDGGQALLKGNGGPFTIMALTGGVFTSFLGNPGGIGFNNSEQVAFVATLRAGGTGIFTGRDPVADKVIATGDPLFGSTVTTLGTTTIGNRALNDAGQVAFRVGLADGRTVLVRADPVSPTTTVEAVSINDGSAQRSMVNSITVTFSTAVTLDPGAFEVAARGGSPVEVSVITSVAGGRTVAVLTFTGADILGGSLADGNYTLTIRGDRIHDSLGRDLDGDGDGTPGGNRVDAFFRLLGDLDGDRDVDGDDLGLFDSGYESAAWYLDLNGDGVVDGLDRTALKQRLGTFLAP